MKNYPHWIGDYQKSTRRLSMLEHGAYRLLIDEYYATEKPLPVDHRTLYRVCMAISNEEREAVDLVIKSFFKKTSGGYTHSRCEAELEKYRKLVNQKKRAANARWDNQDNDSSDLDADAHAHAHADAYADADALAHADGHADGCNSASVPHMLTRTRTRTNKPEPKPEPKTTTTTGAENPKESVSDCGDDKVEESGKVIPMVRNNDPDKMSLQDFLSDWGRTIHCLTPAQAVIQELTELYGQANNRALKQALITLGAKPNPSHNYGTTILRNLITAQQAAATMAASRPQQNLPENPF